MSEFSDAVLRVIVSTQPGDVLTYGEVADEAGYPGAARAVGTVLSRDGSTVPWWRIVGAGGRLVTETRERQARLLRREGVAVRDGRVRPGTTGSVRP